MKVCRFTTEQLEQLAARYRVNADPSQKMSWPKNAENYCRTQLDHAELIEELIDHRRACGMDS
jgi:hypothetical protein